MDCAKPLSATPREQIRKRVAMPLSGYSCRHLLPHTPVYDAKRRHYRGKKKPVQPLLGALFRGFLRQLFVFLENFTNRHSIW